MSKGIEMVSEMASEDSDWSVLFPTPLPNWNGIRMTEVVTSMGLSTDVFLKQVGLCGGVFNIYS
jgi:hypothetical protein